MKNSFKLFLAAAAVVGFASNASAQGSSDNATATAYAKIIAPITLESNGTDLNFGSMVAGDGGSVVVDPSGSRSTMDVSIVAQGGPVSAAGFVVEGEPNYNFTITLPETATIENANDETMTVNTFISSIGTSSTLDAQGDKTFTVGATLLVGDGQETGDYSGTFAVTVAYP
jgi:hypothetical protein